MDSLKYQTSTAAPAKPGTSHVRLEVTLLTECASLNRPTLGDNRPRLGGRDCGNVGNVPSISKGRGKRIINIIVFTFTLLRFF